MAVHNLLWLKDVHEDDEPMVGDAAVRLAASRYLQLQIPNGFVVTTHAFGQFLEHGHLVKKITGLLVGRKNNSQAELIAVAEKIQREINNAEFPKEMADEIMHAYLKLGKLFDHREVAIRASTTLTLETHRPHLHHVHSFTHVTGESNVMMHIRELWASLFRPDRLLWYEKYGIQRLSKHVGVLVQEMVSAEVSGKILTSDAFSGKKDVIVVESIWGNGDLWHEEGVHPESYHIEQDSWKIKDYKFPIQLHKHVHNKGVWGLFPVKTKQSGLTRILNEVKAIELAQAARRLEHHFLQPVEIDWVLVQEALVIIDIKPLVLQNFEGQSSRSINLHKLMEGEGASHGVASGIAVKISSVHDVSKCKDNCIAVVEYTDDEYMELFKKVKGIVSMEGGLTSHAAMVARELDIPCVVGVKDMDAIPNGSVITIDGNKGIVYKGGLKQNHSHSLPKELQDTQLEQDIHKPLILPVSLATLLREQTDFVGTGKREVDNIPIVFNPRGFFKEIGVHPEKLIKEGKHDKLREKIQTFLLEICRKNQTNPVLYQLSDMDCHFYAGLEHGKEFEQDAHWSYRGAQRHVSNPAALELELDALLFVRNKAALRNLWVSIPWIKNIDELLAVKKMIAGHGLIRSASFRLWMQVHTPMMLFSPEQIAEVGVDGVLLDWHSLGELLHGDVHGWKTLENDPAWEVHHVIQVVTEQIKKFKHWNIPVWIQIERPMSDQFIKALYRAGMEQLVVPESLYLDVRRQLIQMEGDLLVVKEQVQRQKGVWVAGSAFSGNRHPVLH